MDMIYTDASKVDIGILDCDFDFEYGDSSTKNTFEIETDVLEPRMTIYAQNSELGGVIDYMDSTNQSSDIPTFKGYSIYGLLMQDIIEAPSGEDNLVLTGDLNEIIESVTQNTLGGFFYVPDTLTGKTITYTFPRHETVCTALMDMLYDYGYRLDAKWVKEYGKPIKAVIQALPSKTISGTFTEDSSIPIRFKWDFMGTNHLICLGKGEGADRTRIDMYLWPDGSISESAAYYTGFDERKEVYDNSNAENEDKLREGGIKRLKENATGSTMSIISDDIDGSYDVGDVIKAKSLVNSSISISKKISGKIVKRKSGTVTVQYKVED